MTGSLNHQLPVIDFSDQVIKQLINPAATTWYTNKCDEVTRALEEYGCFIATYDGVSQQLHDAIFDATRKLFDLPTEVKVLNTSETPSHGYVGQIPVVPLYESLGIENATTTEGVETFTKLMWPSPNHDHHHSFSKDVLLYTKLVAELDQIVMRMIAKRYGIEDHYESLLGSTSYLLKFNKYKSPLTQEDDRSHLGIVPHTDKTFMSILHQNETKGLEIMTKDGHEWIEVHPSPSSFIVMAGDVCTAWTNGKIQPLCHRVMMGGKADRYSLGLFTFIRDLIIEAPQQLVDENHPLQFKPFHHYKYLHYHASDEGRRSKFPLKSYCGV